MVTYRETIKNGDIWMPFYIYKCDRCGDNLPENYPRETFPDKNKDYCGDCAFILGLVNEETYIKKYCFWVGLKGLRAVIHDGKVCLGIGKFAWERNSRDRESVSYREWRESVYKRDNWTCRKCGQHGRKLNAHHIKPYSKYPDLRLDIDNGITLCEKCHREEHRKKE